MARDAEHVIGYYRARRGRLTPLPNDAPCPANRGGHETIASVAAALRADATSPPITVNRWTHGYAYDKNSLFDDEATFAATAKLAHRKAGRVAIANSDSLWSPYAHSAIDAADRAVRELVPRT
jgi:hypothetical protein